MPVTIRTLVKQLLAAGFTNRGGKGSHRNFVHPLGIRVTISGNLSQDAKRYQEKAVSKAIRESQL